MKPTQEQWDKYYADLIQHEDHMDEIKPLPKNFGYDPGGLEEEGGWTIEGGQEAYDKAIVEWHKQLVMGSPNKPGSDFANND